MTADVLRDLVRAKVAFQLRAVETIIRGPLAPIDARKRRDAQRLDGEATKAGNSSKSNYQD